MLSLALLVTASIHFLQIFGLKIFNFPSLAYICGLWYGSESHPTFIIYCESNTNQAEHHSWQAKISVTTLTFLSLQFPDENPLCCSFSLFSESVINPTGHQGQEEYKSR
jgi:hypothetical protein